MAARIVLLVVALILLGCGKDDSRPPPAAGDPTLPQSDDDRPALDLCTSPKEGCPCDEDGETVQCGTVKRRVGDYIACSIGTRSCEDGHWGECVGDKVVQIEDTPLFTRELSTVSNAVDCVDNPCDPYCKQIDEDPTTIELEEGPVITTDEGLELRKVAPMSTDSVACESIEVIPSPQVFNITSFPGSGGGAAATAVATPGLNAEYFSGYSSSGISSSATPSITQIDPNINFSWGNGGPSNGIGSDRFSVRWSGYVIPTHSGQHTFYPSADDGVRLWIDNTLVVDQWKDQGTTEYSSSAQTLQAGVATRIRMEYYENGGGATAILRWQGPSTSNSKVVLATDFLSTAPPSNCKTGTLEAETMTASTGGSTTGGWNIWANGNIRGDFTFGTGSHDVVVWAKSNKDGGQWGHMVVSIGGTQVYDTYVDSTEWKAFRFPYTGTGQQKEVRVAFDNDHYATGEDRNLYVDKVSIECGTGGSNSYGLQIDPPEVQFHVEALPEGCFAGEVTAAWTLDKLGTAIIDQSGLMRVVAPVAGPITVKAYAGSFIATGDTTVNVRVRDDSNVSAATSAKFSGPGSGADNMRVLYPYVDTIFPLGVRPPVIQWDKNGTNATAVRVALVWPVGGTPAFSWERIVTEPNPGRLEIPLEVWKAFEKTAKGDDAAYVVQRLVGSTLKEEVIRPIRFAQAPLRGRIIYTEYGRANNSALMMGVNPGSTEPAYNIFAKTPGASGCPVCHSVSANGKMFVTSDVAWSTTPGVSRFEADGSLKNLSDYPYGTEYRAGANDWRGFSWAPLTPDGTYALAANNVWGNTKQSVVGINSSRQVSVPGTVLSGGRGTGLFAEYFSNTTLSGSSWNRTDATISFDWGSSSPGGTLPTDNFSVRWTGQVQPYFSEQTTFYLTSHDGVRLLIDGTTVIDDWNYQSSSKTRSAVVALTAGNRHSIELRLRDTSGSSSAMLEWQSASLARQVVPQTQLYWDSSTRGVVTQYYDNNDFTGLMFTRVEPHISGNWGTSSPHTSMGSNDFSTRWTAEIQAPVTGNYQFCVSADDTALVKVNGTTVLNVTSSTTNTCSSNVALTAGQKYPIVAEHKETTNSARIELDWLATSGSTTVLARERIPQERLFLPASYTAPTNGLLATYYDTRDFNASLGNNPTNPRAFSRIQPNVDHDWGNAAYREEYYRLTAATDLSGRFTGQLQASCTGVTEFELDKDDGGHLWIGGIRVVTRTSSGSSKGSIYLEQGKRYDVKIDWDQGSGTANLRFRWKPCGGSWATVPSANLFPSGDRGDAGFTLAGGDNGSGTDYFVWRMPTAVGIPADDRTTASTGKWGLSGVTMMVPTFSPDGTKLAFVDGDQAAGAGWRKGLSTFDFDEAAMVFKQRKLLVNTWPYGDVLKWPTFESDSRSIIYSASPPGSYCCQNNWTKYGYMAPTDYYETPGKLMSVDADAATPTAVYMQRASQGERAIDANKAWQPTTLPVAAGGYRWVVFTSSRPYGNTVNLQSQQDYTNTSSYTPMTDTNAIQSQLWVSAMDDEVSASQDRSYPAFWLPNQNYHEDPSKGFINERGFWALDACKPIGTDSASECEVDEDCCGGSGDSPTAACRVDTPVTIPLKRHCSARTTGSSCSLTGGSCGTTDDCCPGTVCVESVCQVPPSFDSFEPGNVERVYEAECRFDELPVWRFFDWKATTPATNSFIEFWAESASHPDGFSTLPVAPTAINDGRVVYLGKASGASSNTWTGNDVGALFDAARLTQYPYLKITMRFAPNQELTASPVLSDFRMNFSCVPAQ